ncbi:MAG TPA: hypothetical protein DD477_05765 [Spirochaetaceae bacterium]|nr:MAG: hypothetical protein A2Y35_01875 [Spirochaetes bacterium GWE1_60_18]HAP44539.1 hypothetical protein [Spirochaetaceae bacterium]HBO40707.1 hypothetical protein [Spirochaetaceae bacterium]
MFEKLSAETVLQMRKFRLLPGSDLGIGLQEQVSNHRKLLRLRVVVVSVSEKTTLEVERYAVERRTKVNR